MEYLTERGCGQSGGRNESWLLSVNSIYGTALWMPSVLWAVIKEMRLAPPAFYYPPSTHDFTPKIISTSSICEVQLTLDKERHF